MKNMKTYIPEREEVHKTDNEGLIAKYVNDKGGLWHFHPEFEIYLNLKCNGTRIIGDNVELFDEYDMVLIAGNIPHCWNYYKAGGTLPENHGIIVHFPLSFLGTELINQYEMTKVRELFEEAERGVCFSIQDSKDAEKYLKCMIVHSGIDKIIDFLNVLRILSYSEKRRHLCTENYKIENNGMNNKRMTDVFNYIRDNFSHHITLEEISKVAEMKPFYFGKYFKKYTGTGFINYINQIRMNRASYLLRETTNAIKCIARECGFESISNFNKQFKKIFGISPKTYRAQFIVN